MYLNLSLIYIYFHIYLTIHLLSIMTPSSVYVLTFLPLTHRTSMHISIHYQSIIIYPYIICLFITYLLHIYVSTYHVSIHPLQFIIYLCIYLPTHP